MSMISCNYLVLKRLLRLTNCLYKHNPHNLKTDRQKIKPYLTIIRYVFFAPGVAQF